MITKKTCIAFVLIVCLVVAVPLSAFSSSDEGLAHLDKYGSGLMDISKVDDVSAVNIIDEPIDSESEPNGNSNEPSGGTQEPMSSTDESSSDTDEPNDGESKPSDGLDELDDDIGESGGTTEEIIEFVDDSEFTGDADSQNIVEFDDDDDSIVDIIPSQNLMFDMARTDVPIRVETQAQLINVFNYGAATGGDYYWTGERTVEIAFDHFTGTIIPNAGYDRVITLKTDGTSRNITIGNNDRHFYIGNKVTLIIDDENLHFVGRDLDNTTGGGISVTDGGTLKLLNGTIRNCRAGFGGGVNISGASALFEMHGGFIEKNRATDSGGGICTTGDSTFNMYEGTISENKIPTAGNSGGGVRVMGSSLFNMQGGLIENNEVPHAWQFSYGGGVIVGEVDQDWRNSTFNMNGGIIRNNKAQWGGGVAAYNGFFNLGTGRTERGAAPDNQTGDVYGPIISDNEAMGQGAGYTGAQVGHGGGGGVWVYDYRGATYSFVMHSGAIAGNETRYRGGGVFVNRADCVILGGEVSNNHTTDNANSNSGGGGVYLHTNDTRFMPSLIVKNAIISGNSSRIGGGIARNSEVPISISDNAVISGNTAQLDGGGIHAGVPGTGSAITSASVGIQRNNLRTDASVIFQGNRSQQAVSYGLTVAQVSINNDLFSRVNWSGLNSARGTQANEESYHLFNNHDINNLQGSVVRDLGALSISKTVDGDLGNMLMGFDFTIYFKDSDGNTLAENTRFDYIGSTISGLGAAPPSNGTLTLDSDGSATFTLTHGQAIEIQDIPLGGFVQVVETPYEGYETTIIESDNPHDVISSNDSTLIYLTDDRSLSFTNTRNMVSPPTGVDSDDIGRIMLLVVVVALAGLTVFAANTYYRYRRQAKDCKW